MTNILDFSKFKEIKDSQESLEGNRLEDNYLKYLTHVNKFTGTPTTLDGVFEVFYYTIRYLEGTINALSVLKAINVHIPNTVFEEGKQKIITWLESIIEDLRNV